MSPTNKTTWMRHAAVSHWRQEESEYERPVLSANAADRRTQLSSDAIQFGFSVYEGMRVYVADNQYLIFRASDHHERMMRSCAALAMPCPTYETFIEAIKLVVGGNYDGHTKRLYIRPIVFSAGGGIMPQQDSSYIYAALCTTFDPDIHGFKVLVEAEHPRTVPAFSAVKTATNYASSALMTRQAQSLGYDTVLWLDRHGYLQECTTMNVFACMNGQIVTPVLGEILPGVTRRTMIELLAWQGNHVAEKELHIRDVVHAIQSGRLSGVFTTSTALGINNVTHLRYGDADYELSAKLPDVISTSKQRYRVLTEEFSASLAKHEDIGGRSYLGSLRAR